MQREAALVRQLLSIAGQHMDLNIVVESDQNRDSAALIVRKLQTAERLGYKVVALAVKIGTADVGKHLPDPPLISVPDSCRMKVLTRVTVCLTDGNAVYKLLQNASFKRYDLFGVEVGSEKILSQVCTGSIDCDIVTFRAAERLNFSLKRANLSLPRTKGICFEINFTDAFTSSTGRMNTISTAQLLVEKTKGKNVIISSGAATHIWQRGTYDVANLGLLFGLSEIRGKEAVFKTANTCIKHAEGRKNASSLAVTIVSDPKQGKDLLLKKKLQLLKHESGAGEDEAAGDSEPAEKRVKRQVS